MVEYFPMEEALRISSQDKILASLPFIPYRSLHERRVVPFLPAPNEPQTLEIDTPWGTHLTARKGDFLISEVATPDDYWAIDPVIFEESYVMVRPGYCVKKAVILLVPLTKVTRDPNRTVIPGFVVSSVVHQPFGAFPSPAQGYARRDDDFYFEYHRATRTREGFSQWLEKWVLGVNDHREFLDHLSAARVDGLKPRERWFAADVNFGY